MSDTDTSICLLHSLEDTYGVSSVQYDNMTIWQKLADQFII